ncbi:hypothetical protein OSCI_3410040 [Kamptonema sp. PCC 6506]|nr:hypothetical protein OSCI_3410040 [Kamptonema sp. PCC 6506]
MELLQDHYIYEAMVATVLIKGRVLVISEIESAIALYKLMKIELRHPYKPKIAHTALATSCI